MYSVHSFQYTANHWYTYKYMQHVPPMRAKDWLALAGFILISEAAGAIGAFFTAPAITTWYTSLVQPALAPPNWVFGPVWTTLYILMGIAAFMVFRHNEVPDERRTALLFFFSQLVLNALWSVLFFGQQMIGLAAIELGILWIAIFGTFTTFSRVSRFAAWLLIPYLAWVTFAGYLNVVIWLLNK